MNPFAETKEGLEDQSVNWSVETDHQKFAVSSGNNLAVGTPRGDKRCNGKVHSKPDAIWGDKRNYKRGVCRHGVWSTRGNPLASGIFSPSFRRTDVSLPTSADRTSLRSGDLRCDSRSHSTTTVPFRYTRPGLDVKPGDLVCRGLNRGSSRNSKFYTERSSTIIVPLRGTP